MQTICIDFLIFLQNRLKLSDNAALRAKFKTFALLCKIVQTARFCHFLMQKNGQCCIKTTLPAQICIEMHQYLLIDIAVAEA